MQIKKIILKNFIVPGEQWFEFSDQHILKNGIFSNPDDLAKINDLLNGSWINSTINFEKYYPKFSKKNKSSKMDLQIDALFYISLEELNILNNMLKKQGPITPLKSNLYYYSIKCKYPYIFPMISIVPAEEVGDKPFALGMHYEKFFKSNLSKKDLLAAVGVNAIGHFREKYLEYKNTEVEETRKEIHNKYLEIIKSTFTYGEEFIYEVNKVISNIDDGDIISFGDHEDLFFNNEGFKNFLNAFPLFVKDEKSKIDFSNLLFEFYLRDLQWVYLVRTPNSLLEIKKILFSNYCEKSFYSKELIDFFKTKLLIDERLLNLNSSVQSFEKKIKSSTSYNEVSKNRKAPENSSAKKTSKKFASKMAKPSVQKKNQSFRKKSKKKHW